MSMAGRKWLFKWCVFVHVVIYPYPFRPLFYWVKIYNMVSQYTMVHCSTECQNRKNWMPHWAEKLDRVDQQLYPWGYLVLRMVSNRMPRIPALSLNHCRTSTNWPTAKSGGVIYCRLVVPPCWFSGHTSNIVYNIFLITYREQPCSL